MGPKFRAGPHAQAEPLLTSKSAARTDRCPPALALCASLGLCPRLFPARLSVVCLPSIVSPSAPCLAVAHSSSIVICPSSASDSGAMAVVHGPIWKPSDAVVCGFGATSGHVCRIARKSRRGVWWGLSLAVLGSPEGHRVQVAAHLWGGPRSDGGQMCELLPEAGAVAAVTMGAVVCSRYRVLWTGDRWTDGDQSCAEEPGRSRLLARPGEAVGPRVTLGAGPAVSSLGAAVPYSVPSRSPADACGVNRKRTLSCRRTVSPTD